jgi:hypothetical protein
MAPRPTALLLCAAALAALAVLGRAALRAPVLSEDEARSFYRRLQAEGTRQYGALSAPEQAALYAGDADVVWADAPGAWHQQVARIVDHRFKTFDAMFAFVMEAKKAGVGAVMLAQIQNTTGCPGPWYNGLQLCDHINGSYPVVDGTLEQWKDMLDKIKPMRLMWWNNPVYWDVQGGVWAEAVADKDSSVGKWFSWGPESCSGVTPCDGSNVVVPGVGCAQGSWGSKGSNPKTEGIQSALASVGSKEYADYMVEAMTNTWTGNLGIDGYTEDCSCNYGCMMQLTDPEKGSLPDWANIVKRVRATHPQLVMSGEGYGSWAEMIIADANLGGQGSNTYHVAFQKAVTDGDASQLEHLASTSGADAASVLCYLNPAYDGLQPGGCPTMYFRDSTATITDLKQYRLWVALEAGSGIVSQHDYDPSSTCSGFSGCSFWSSGPCKPGGSGKCGAWWNVTNDPSDPTEGAESPLTAFQKHRALNRLALRTKLNISSAAAAAAAPDEVVASGADAEAAAGSGYTKYPSANCYRGAGGIEMDKGAAIIAPTAADCTAYCDNSTACDCVTYCAEKSGDCAKKAGRCWRRTLCEPKKFERDAATKQFEVYVKKDWVPPPPPPAPPNKAKGALAYLKHDAMGPTGDAAIMIFNPGAAAQSVTVDLSFLPPHLLDGKTVPHDLFEASTVPTTTTTAAATTAVAGGTALAAAAPAAPALSRSWTVAMGAGEAKAFGGFSLASFAPRVGKKASCTSSYSRPVDPQSGSTLQGCFLECLKDSKCENVFVEYVDIIWMEKPPAVSCTLLGAVGTPSTDCKPGTGTLVKKLTAGRPTPTPTSP